MFFVMWSVSNFFSCTIFIFRKNLSSITLDVLNRMFSAGYKREKWVIDG